MVKSYRDLCKRDSTIEERRRYGIGDIYINKARCNKCNEIVISENRHDFRTCSCGNLSVDGGSWYCKRTFGTMNYTELSIMYKNIE